MAGHCEEKQMVIKYDLKTDNQKGGIWYLWNCLGETAKRYN